MVNFICSINSGTRLRLGASASSIAGVHDLCCCCGRASTRSSTRTRLVQLTGKAHWSWLDREIAPLYSDKGRLGIETRFVLGLLLFKHIYSLSDEAGYERWIYDPYIPNTSLGKNSSSAVQPREWLSYARCKAAWSDIRLDLRTSAAPQSARQTGPQHISRQRDHNADRHTFPKHADNHRKVCCSICNSQ
jgi:hypothetical protein